MCMLVVATGFTQQTVTFTQDQADHINTRIHYLAEVYKLEAKYKEEYKVVKKDKNASKEFKASAKFNWTDMRRKRKIFTKDVDLLNYKDL